MSSSRGPPFSIERNQNNASCKGEQATASAKMRSIVQYAAPQSRAQSATAANLPRLPRPSKRQVEFDTVMGDLGRDPSPLASLKPHQPVTRHRLQRAREVRLRLAGDPR